MKSVVEKFHRLSLFTFHFTTMQESFQMKQSVDKQEKGVFAVISIEGGGFISSQA